MLPELCDGVLLCCDVSEADSVTYLSCVMVFCSVL